MLALELSGVPGAVLSAVVAKVHRRCWLHVCTHRSLQPPPRIQRLFRDSRRLTSLVFGVVMTLAVLAIAYAKLSEMQYVIAMAT
jgi:hypothetical protein